MPGGDRLRAFENALPVGQIRVTLGEGATPLLRLARLFPTREVYAKAEWMNPTGSFKDRGAAVAINAAMELGAQGIVVASTGNNAASVSAYASRAGLPCLVILPRGTARGKLVQALAHGAKVRAMDGDFSDAYALAEIVRREADFANLTSTYVNPFMTAAHATIAWEVLEQTAGRVGSVVIPIGAGPMLEGIAAGFERAIRAGDLSTMPFLVGVQAAGCAPIARAFASGLDAVAPWPTAPVGIAASINDPLRGYAADGTRTLRVLRRYAGVAVAVADDEIEAAMVDLGTSEGIAVEPAAAATLAALRHGGCPEMPEPIMLILSGHALKDPDRQPLARTDLAGIPNNADMVLLARSMVAGL